MSCLALHALITSKFIRFCDSKNPLALQWLTKTQRESGTQSGYFLVLSPYREGRRNAQGKNRLYRHTSVGERHLHRQGRSAANDYQTSVSPTVRQNQKQSNRCRETEIKD